MKQINHLDNCYNDKRTSKSNKSVQEYETQKIKL